MVRNSKWKLLFKSASKCPQKYFNNLFKSAGFLNKKLTFNLTVFKSHKFLIFNF